MRSDSESSAEGESRRRLLDDALDASDDAEFSRALSAHGAVRGDQIETLERLAGEGAAHRRANAVRLLALARDPAKRQESLARVARTTDDLEAWAIAVDALFRDAPEVAAEIARGRPEFVKAALARDGVVLRAGVRAARATSDPGLAEVITKRLADADGAVRRAVIDGIDTADVKTYQTQLRQRLGQEARPDVIARLAALLAHSDDETARRELIDYFWSADADRQNAIADVFRADLQPWLRDYWLGVAREGGERRARAMGILSDTAGDELLPVCVELYERSPKRGEPGFVEAMLAQGPCDRIVSRLAGRPLQGNDALAFARERLSRKGRD